MSGDALARPTVWKGWLWAGGWEGLPGLVEDVYLGKGTGMPGSGTITSILGVRSVARPGEDGGFAPRDRVAQWGWREDL